MPPCCALNTTRLLPTACTCRLGLVAVLIDQDSDFFDFLMLLWLRDIQVEQVFKKLGEDGCAPAALCCCGCCPSTLPWLGAVGLLAAGWLAGWLAIGVSSAAVLLHLRTWLQQLLPGGCECNRGCDGCMQLR